MRPSRNLPVSSSFLRKSTEVEMGISKELWRMLTSTNCDSSSSQARHVTDSGVLIGDCAPLSGSLE